MKKGTRFFIRVDNKGKIDQKKGTLDFMTFAAEQSERDALAHETEGPTVPDGITETVDKMFGDALGIPVSPDPEPLTEEVELVEEIKPSIDLPVEGPMLKYIDAIRVVEGGVNVELREDLQNTTATLADLKNATGQMMQNIQKALTSLGGGGLGEKDVIKLIEERDLDSDEIQHIITLLEGHYLDSAEGHELILDTVDSDYINLRVDHPPYDSATTISIIKEQVDSDYVNAKVNLTTHSINELFDVDASTASTNDILEYNGSEWQATNRTSSGVLNFKGVVDVTVENPPDSADLTIGDTYMASHSGIALPTWGHMQDGGDSVQTKDLFVWEPSSDSDKVNAFEHLPATTDVGVVEVREGFGIDVIQDDPNRPTVLIDQTELATTFLPLTGGTITGDLKVSSIDNVSGGNSLTIKQDGNNRFTFHQMNTSHTSIDMTNNRITNLLSPASGGDAANKSYVDTAVGSGDNVTIADKQTISGEKTFSSAARFTNYAYLSYSSSNSNGLLRRDTIESMIAASGGGSSPDYKITKNGNNYYIESNS